MATTTQPLTLRLLFGDAHLVTPKRLRRMLILRGGITALPGVTTRVCGWCQRVATGPSNWLGVEEAERSLPECDVTRLTHGMCADCFLELAGEIRRLLVVRGRG
jgi:hypothetical protein